MKTMSHRTTYKYHFKLGNKIVHTGITTDIDRRQAEHRQKPGWERGHIFQVGVRTTFDAARAWEDEQRNASRRASSRRTRRGGAMLGERDRIVLTGNISDHHLKAGDVGTIVHVHRGGRAFEVEFLALDGQTAALATVPAARLRPVAATDLTHAREMRRVG